MGTADLWICQADFLTQDQCAAFRQRTCLFHFENLIADVISYPEERLYCRCSDRSDAGREARIPSVGKALRGSLFEQVDAAIIYAGMRLDQQSQSLSVVAHDLNKHHQIECSGTVRLSCMHRCGVDLSLRLKSATIWRIVRTTTYRVVGIRQVIGTSRIRALIAATCQCRMMLKICEPTSFHILSCECRNSTALVGVNHDNSQIGSERG